MTAIPVNYNDALKADYNSLFAKCVVSPSWEKYVDVQVRKIAAGKLRYEAVAKIVGCPWFLIGLIHAMECGLSFEKHLHNGDPLSKKTTHVPANHPLTPGPWTWEESAVDALTKARHFGTWHDWSIAGILYQLEGFNGYGYRQYHPTVKTPYLWSFTNNYKIGKYEADGKWNGNLVSKQIGCAAFLKRAVVLGIWKP